MISEIHKAYRYELQPTKGQEASLRKHCGVARFAYNWGLQKHIDSHKAGDKFQSAVDLHKELCKVKASDYPWMYEVSKCAPQEALRNLDKAFKNFFRNLKKGRKPGFPRFKRRGVRDSYSVTGALGVVGNRKVKLPKLGNVRTKESTYKFEGRVLGATVSREAGRWFVSFKVVVQKTLTHLSQAGSIGVDLGLTKFATFSDGRQLDPPRPLKAAQRRLARAQRQHSRKVKGSSNRRKSAARLARIHFRVKNIRKDFIHKVTTYLARTKKVVAIEDLCVKGMIKNRRFAGSISDMGWGEFRRQLEYKTQWYGSELKVIGRFEPSSKMCSECGHVKRDLSLSDRMFRCSQCGLEMDRDFNAAVNILNIATGSSPGSNACGDESAGLPSGK